jgi:predicted secreted protein
MDLYFVLVKVLLVSVSFVVNLLTILAHVVDPLRVFQSRSSMFVLNVTVVDCTLSLLFLFVATLKEVYQKEFISNRYLLLLTDVTIRIASMSALAYFSLTLEVYFSISRPFWHRTKLTANVCRYWIVFTWLFHFAFYELMVFILPVAYEGLLIVGYCASLFFIILSLNLATFISLRKQSQGLRQQRNEATVRALQTRQKNEKRFLITIAILSIIMTVCFCPYFVFKILDTFPHLVPNTSAKVWKWLDFLTLCLIITNALINPFFYLWRLPKYKKTFKKLYCKCLKQH